MKRMMTNKEVVDIVNDTVKQPTYYRNCFEFRDAEESASATTHCTFNIFSTLNMTRWAPTIDDIYQNSSQLFLDDMPYLATGHYNNYPIVSIMYDSLTTNWTFYYVANGKLAYSYFHVGEQGAFGFNVNTEEIY